MIKKGRKAKKFLSLLLSVAMALTMFAGVGQVEVKADETDSGAEVTHTDHEGWTDLNSISSIEKYNGLPQGKNFEYQGRYYIEEEGNYYLSSDIVSDNRYGAIQVGDGRNSCEVTICLNGHKISANIGVSDCGVVNVQPNCKLTVVDCNTDETGGIADSNYNGAAIYSKGNLKVNGVKDLSGKYGIREAIGYSVPDESDLSAVSIEINNAKITGTESSVYANGVKTLDIKSTTCTGGICATCCKNTTVEDSTIDGADDSAIEFWNGNGSKLVVDHSNLKTETEYASSVPSYVLESWNSKGLVEIEIIDSKLSSTSCGLRAGGGEKVTIRRSDIICAPTENVSNESGHAINYWTCADRDNSLTIDGGTVQGIDAGISFRLDREFGEFLDLTLSGTIDFGETKPSYPFFTITPDDHVNLHMDELITTDKLFIDIQGSGAGEISNVICDGDYSSYFVFPQYLVSGKETAEGKYLLNLTQRSITTQPTEENPQVTVNDTNNVTYQWYQADAVEKEITDELSDNTIEAEYSCGSYEDGYWKPEEISHPELENPYYRYQIGAHLLSGGQIVLEAPTGSSLDNLGNYLWCVDDNAGGLVEKENVDGKLYFTIPSAGTYGIVSANMDNETSDCSFTGNEQIKITFKGIEIKKAVAGSTQSRLVTSEAGSFCCKATWAAGTPFEYSTVSNAVTVTQPIEPVEPTKYAVTVTDGTTASAEYAAGETVTITANAAPERKKFDKWEVVSGDVTLADASQVTTTFTMPADAVTVKATYKDASGEPTPEPKPEPKPEPTPEPTPEPKPGPSENGAEYILADGTKATFDETYTVIDSFGKYDSFKIYKGKHEGQEQKVYFLIDSTTHVGYTTADFTQYNSNLEAFKNSIASVVNAAGDEAALDGMAKVIYGFTRIPVPSTVIDSHEHAWSEWKVDETNKNRMVSTCSGCDIKKYKNIETEEGSFEKEAEVGADSPIQTATLNNGKDELLHSNIFGAGEKATINGGTDAKVWVVIDQKTALSDTDKTSMEEAAKTAVGNSDHMTYFDATLFKKVGDAPQSPVAEPGVEIKIAIRIPDSLINTDPAKTRTYKIIRLHGDSVDILDGTYDATTGEFTFTTDKFSTYAIVYSDASKPSGGSGISGDSSSASSSAAVTKVTITPDKDTLTKAGETLQLTANFEPANAADKKVTWSSSDTSIATVDENGKVTAVGNGTAIITAKSSNGKTATITITVALTSETEKPENKPEETVETDIKMDTGFAALCPKSAKSTKTTNTLNWTKVSGADGYVVYGAPCNTKNQTNKFKKLATIKNGKATTYKATGLKSGTYYKYMVKAYKLVDGKKVYLAKSETIHVATAGGKYGNAESVKVNKTSVSLKTGEKFTIQASMVEKDQPVKQHAAIRFESSNSKVASVTSKGVIKAKSKGTCYIYVYAQNGVYKRIKVTVK